MTGATQFGIALPMYGHNLNAGQLLSELTDEVCAAEAAGLDLVLVPEHHSGPPDTLSDPITIATWLLSKTSTIKIGTGVLLLPLHSTVQLAEQAALLQHLSGGRFILGLGAGYQRADFDLFGADYEARSIEFEAKLQELRRIFLEPIETTTLRPTLEPHGPPPLWLGAWSNAGIRRAALMSDGWIADPARSTEEIADMAAKYRAWARDESRPSHTVVMREAWVDESDEEARSTYYPVVAPIFNYYLKNDAISHDGDSKNLDEFIGERTLVGSTTLVSAQAVDLVHKTGADTVVFGIRHPGGPSHAQVLKCIEQLGRNVIPRAQECISKEVGKNGR